MDPLTLALLAGTAMSVGGGLMGRSEAQENAERAAAARNAVLADYLQRMAGLTQESRGLFDSTLGGFGQPAQAAALTTAQGDRTAAGVGNITAPPASTDFALSRSAPKAVHGVIGQRMADAFAGAQDRAKAQGALGGFGDQWAGNTRGIADASRRMGTLENFSKGETGLLNSQLDLAEAGAQRQPSPWPGILQGGGQLLAGFAGSSVGRRPATPTAAPAGVGAYPYQYGGF
jgi:hypothetical protein